ncbi:hypothetical protein CFD26_102300 [Aspergillus turcosus]|uniref:Uncharacterized protein n=1 Tax=Aspergillus turcosus TaxID=1245748 RepID=A0A421D3U2_9EURO|nr:hypothetical protein CFD26_102300 [Aspergillus turcosus]
MFLSVCTDGKHSATYVGNLAKHSNRVQSVQRKADHRRLVVPNLQGDAGTATEPDDEDGCDPEDDDGSYSGDDDGSYPVSVQRTEAQTDPSNQQKEFRSRLTGILNGIIEHVQSTTLASIIDSPFDPSFWFYVSNCNKTQGWSQILSLMEEATLFEHLLWLSRVVYRRVLQLGLLHNTLGVGPERRVYHGAGGSGVRCPALRVEGAEGSERGVDAGGGQHYVATGACDVDLRAGSRQARSGLGGAMSTITLPALKVDVVVDGNWFMWLSFEGGGALGQRQGEDER